MAEINVDVNPDIARWNTARSFQQTRLRVAEAETGTDLELALGMKLEKMSGDRAFILGASLPLPTSDRNQDELRALSYEMEQVNKLKQDARNTIQAQLAAAVEIQISARREMEIMSTDIIPLARQAYDETRAAHKRGLYGLTDVLETRRNLFELRQAELDSQLRFFNATVRIARLTGRKILDMNPVSTEVD